MRESKKKITIVCCYNDAKKYQLLQNSLKKQNTAYELIGIDNQRNQFRSCSSALNSVLEQIQTEYVIFSHQDIELPESDTLKHFLMYMEQLSEGDILGAAGAVEAVTVSAAAKGRQLGDKAGTCVLSCTRHGKDLVCAGEVEYSGITACDTVDECFFGGKTKTFTEEPLDERLCDTWHLYAVERCLRARVQGGKVFVCDVVLNHYSEGKIDHSYNENFRRIAKYYAKNSNNLKNRKNIKGAGQGMRWIRTVCGSTRTDWLHRNLFYWKRELLIRLKRY